ncbi:UNVERIFIED_CONTAM: hypothetical protein NCL1_11184 [Trichonephila clavipes]
MLCAYESEAIRNFGLEHRYEITPSNESFFPAAMYTAFGYNTDTLKDYFYKFALNAQGFTSRNFHDAFLQLFNLRPSEDIPKVKIPEIFPEAHVVPRDPEFWRFTVFQKMFYINSYYYYDSEEHQTGDIFHLFRFARAQNYSMISATERKLEFSGANAEGVYT